MDLRKLEVIASTIEDAIEGALGGASSLEIVQDLAVGGLTPPLSVVKAIRDTVSIHLRVIVRPHAPDFVYTPAEVEQMLKDIEALKQIGADGVVFGALHSDDSIDLDLTTQIARAVHPLEMTFHRAIDVSRNAGEALPALKGVAQRILTSGQADNVWDGRAKISAWVTQYGHDFTFACGGGIRLDRLDELVRATNTPEYHVGTAAQTDHRVDCVKVREILQIINAV